MGGFCVFPVGSRSLVAVVGASERIERAVVSQDAILEAVVQIVQASVGWCDWCRGGAITIVMWWWLADALIW